MSAEATVLFDAPGPKARIRHLIIAVIGALALLGLLALTIRGLSNPKNNQLTAQKWLPFVEAETWTAYLLPGILTTLQAAAISVVLAAILGMVLGMGRLSELAPIRAVCGTFVEFFRAVPVLMMMLFAYFFGQTALGITGDAASLFGVVVGLTLYNSCVIAELVRSGVGSLPKGQREAGLALGMSPSQTMITVLLPQAITAMLPSLISQLVVILKDSALGSWINYSELLRASGNLSSYRGNLIPTLIVTAAIYIILNYALTRVARIIERRLQLSRRGPKTPPIDPMLNPAVVPVAAAAATPPITEEHHNT